MKTLSATSYLDGLRGLAVIFVVLSHLSNTGLHLHQWLNFSGSGKYGVFLFFLLSAFLLTKIQIQSGEITLGYLTTYAKRRFLRIYPIFFLVLVACALLTKYGYGAITVSLSPQEVVSHLLLQQGDELFWAIPVEFTFYFVLPLVAGLTIAMDKLKAGIGGVFLVFVILATSYLWPAHNYPVNGIALYPYTVLFFTGMLIAWIDHRKQVLIKKQIYAQVAQYIGWLALISVFMLIPFYYANVIGEELTQDKFHQSYQLFAILWGAVLLSLIISDGRLRSILSSRIFVYIGKISFSIYLSHWTIIKSVNYLLPGYPALARFALVIFLTLMISSLTYRFIERPLYRIGHKRHALRGG